MTRRLPDAVEAALQRDFAVQLNRDDHPFTAQELRQALAECDGLLCTVTDRMGADVLAGPVRARILANFGVGFNHIDPAAARRRGLVVTNTPGVLTDATADLAMLLILMVARRAGEGERDLRAGRWHGWGPTHLMGTMVTGKTLGIVGLGRIGRALAHRARAGFSMSVCSWMPRPLLPPEAEALGVTQCGTLDELLARSDFVSLHCPASGDTRHLIGAAELSRMRPGAFLVNTARGEVVDEAALAAALGGGRLGGAGLDVYEEEPQVSPALLQLENVVLLPHLGSATLETRTAMGMKAVANLTAFFETGEGLDVVGAAPDPAGEV